MPTDQKLQLLEAISESLESTTDFEPNPEFVKELDRRAALADQGETQGIAAEVVFEELRERKYKR